MKTSCLRLKLVELNFFASFNADDQRKLTYLMYLNRNVQYSKLLLKNFSKMWWSLVKVGLCFNGNFLLIVMLCLVCLASGVNGSPGCQSKEHEISLKCMKSKQGKTNQGPKIEASTTIETTKASTTSNYQLFKCVSLCIYHRWSYYLL